MAREINLFGPQSESEVVERKIAHQPAEEMRDAYIQTLLPGLSQGLVDAPQLERKQEMQARHQVKRIIEALLFAASEPIPIVKIREVTDSIHPLKPRVLKELIQSLQNDYITQQRAFRLEEIAQGYILRSCEEFAPYIELLYRNKRTEKLSQPSAEVLAIIAYKQPITRPQIDAIRGVDSSGVIYSLVERQLIEPVGKLDVPGRPTLFGITKGFLKHFGLKDLTDLPEYSSTH